MYVLLQSCRCSRRQCWLYRCVSPLNSHSQHLYRNSFSFLFCRNLLHFFFLFTLIYVTIVIGCYISFLLLFNPRIYYYYIFYVFLMIRATSFSYFLPVFLQTLIYIYIFFVKKKNFEIFFPFKLMLKSYFAFIIIWHRYVVLKNFFLLFYFFSSNIISYDTKQISPKLTRRTLNTSLYNEVILIATKTTNKWKRKLYSIIEAQR